MIINVGEWPKDVKNCQLFQIILSTFDFSFDPEAEDPLLVPELCGEVRIVPSQFYKFIRSLGSRIHYCQCILCLLKFWEKLRHGEITILNTVNKKNIRSTGKPDPVGGRKAQSEI